LVEVAACGTKAAGLRPRRLDPDCALAPRSSTRVHASSGVAPWKPVSALCGRCETCCGRVFIRCSPERPPLGRGPGLSVKVTIGEGVSRRTIARVLVAPILPTSASLRTRTRRLALNTVGSAPAAFAVGVNSTEDQHRQDGDGNDPEENREAGRPPPPPAAWWCAPRCPENPPANAATGSSNMAMIALPRMSHARPCITFENRRISSSPLT